MGFLDLFIERSDDTKKEVKQNAPPPISNFGTIPVTPVASPVSYTVPSYQAGISQEDLIKFNAHFDELFEKANLPGPDYYEFQKMCQAMATLPDDVKFPAVFGGLQVQGLTKQILVESAGHYINAIDEDSKKFNTAIDQKIMSEVQRKRAEAESKRKGISDREVMIRNLQEEMAKETIAIAELEKDAMDQEQKANQKSGTYKIACETRKAIINSDVQKINNLIK